MGKVKAMTTVIPIAETCHRKRTCFWDTLHVLNENKM